MVQPLARSTSRLLTRSDQPPPCGSRFGSGAALHGSAQGARAAKSDDRRAGGGGQRPRCCALCAARRAATCFSVSLFRLVALLCVSCGCCQPPLRHAAHTTNACMWSRQCRTVYKYIYIHVCVHIIYIYVCIHTGKYGSLCFVWANSPTWAGPKRPPASSYSTTPIVLKLPEVCNGHCPLNYKQTALRCWLMFQPSFANIGGGVLFCCGEFRFPNIVSGGSFLDSDGNR